MLHQENPDADAMRAVKEDLTSKYEKIMDNLTQLLEMYEEIEDFQKQEEIIDEIESMNEEFSHVTASYNKFVGQLRRGRIAHSKSSERSSLYSTDSRRQRLLAEQKRELEQQYKEKMAALEKDFGTEKMSMRDSDDGGERSIERWLETTEQEENQAMQNIGKDMWKQLKRVSIPIFDGDKRMYETWKAAFTACIDQAPATGEYKLLQLRQYLSGEALRAIDGLGHSELAYKAAKERLERKFGGARRKVLKYIADLDDFRPIREDHPRDVETFSDLLDIAIINLKEAGRDEELGNGIFYHKLQRKLPEQMLARYKRWVCEQHYNENVESLKRFVTEEAEYQVAAVETLYGLQQRRRNQHQNNNNHRSNSFFGKSGEKKKCCVCCKEPHRIWECSRFKEENTARRWEIAKENRICFRCLSGNHLAKECRNSRICGIDGCTDTHNRLLHKRSQDSEKKEKKEESKASEKNAEGEDVQRTHTAAIQKQPNRRADYISLRTVPVVLKNGSRKIVVNALLDDGSTKTYLNNDVATELGLQGWRQNITITKLNGQAETLETTPVEFELESIDGKVSTKMEAYTMNRVTGSLKPINWKVKSRSWKHLKDIPFPNIGPKGIVDILIGIDYADFHCAYKEVKGKPNEPVARLTPLGWTCVGGNTTSMLSHFVMTESQDKDLVDANETIKKLWEIEGENMSLDEPKMSKDEATAMEIAQKSLNYKNGRYEIKLPWKSDKNLENNYDMAAKRLKATEKRLLKEEHLGQTYSDIIKQYVKKGYLEKVEDTTDKDCWYLPHFPVVRPDKSTTKVRIVFDGAAKFSGTSLNNAIHQGPKLQQDLVKVLLRIRKYPVALVCDIAEMYLQIGIHKEDRKYQRILWRDLKTEEEPSVYEFKRMVFGINSSPFEAQFVAKEHATRNLELFPNGATSVLLSTYMDDTMDSVGNEDEGEILYQELKELWNSAGMHARKWMSNSPELLRKIPESDRAEKIDLDAGELPIVKTLGVVWDAKADIFTFSSVVGDTAIHYTKRMLLKKMATLFDPLGFLSPFTIRIKIMMQDLWTKGLDWDDSLPQECNAKVSKWFGELKNLSEIQVPRCLQLKSKTKERNIHVFTDASSEAYGAVIYQQNTYKDGSTSLQFIMSKSRVSPLKLTSIPRLELLGAILGLQLAKKIADALQVDLSNVTFWSDSMNVLWWIRNQSRKLKPFVGNRISLIQSNTAAQQWRYVPTKQNPADILTRGSSVKELAQNSFWWNGPQFLTGTQEDWPKNRFDLTEEAKVEVKKKEAMIPSTMLSINAEEEIITITKYSSWKKIVAIVGWITRFAHNCRSQRNSRVKGELDPSELNEAKTWLIKQAQVESFAEEYRCLLQSQPIRTSSKISSLLPQIDEDGLLRANGRLQHAEYLPYDVKYPVILPRDHYLTKLIVKQHHEDNKHVLGTNHLLSKLSERFWIIRAREVIRQVESECSKCKKIKAKVAEQVMAPLPRMRLKEPLAAFTRVGVDYAGPFMTIQGRGKKRAKRYLCLFTCLLSRAVHLEIAYSLDTDSFLNAFYRMSNRRGLPREVLSDNGTNFASGNNELKELLKSLDRDKITKSTAHKGVKWHFNVPLGPHHGGVFETMVKAAKRAIYRIYENADISDEELHTAFTGAESLLNSRPLTYQSGDIRDDTPITPNHLLIGMAGERFAPETVETEPFHPRKRWRRVQELVRHFWKRWMREWLPTLNKRNKWKKEKKDLKRGNIVIVVSPDTPRGKWPLGRITKVHPGTDGHVRVANVKIGEKEYTRPISRLCPLELD